MSPSIPSRERDKPSRLPSILGKVLSVLLTAGVLAGCVFLFMREIRPPAPPPLVSVATPVSDTTPRVAEADSLPSEASEPAEEESGVEDETLDYDPVAAEWNALAHAVTEAVVAGATREAQVLTEQARQARSNPDMDERLLALDSMLTGASEMNNRVVAGLSTMIGQEMELQVKGKARRLILRAVTTDALSASPVDEAGRVRESATLDISMDAVDPAEKLRWIGDAATASVALMKCMLHAQAGNMDQARTYALRCDPITEQLLARIEAVAGSGGEAESDESEEAL